MSIRTMSFAGRARRATRIAAVAVLGVGAALTAAGAAHADSVYVSWSSSYLISASYDAQSVAVSGGSYSNGAPIIQWPADGGNEQLWRFGNVVDNGVNVGTLILNVNSGECLTTDGNAGDTVFQLPCDEYSPTQLFSVHGNLDGYDSISNISSGLYLDVSGYSWNEGANIDTWYQNSQPNQTFFTLPY